MLEVTTVLKVLQKEIPRSQKIFSDVSELALRFLDFLNSQEINSQLSKVHRHGATSTEIQSVVMPGALQLGFSSEKKGLFDNYKVAALRPDYYLQIGDSGVIFEVERGKTTANNMDLLDLWKCHICESAEYLFLLVPQVRQTSSGRDTRPFKQVQSRLETFFNPKNYVNVEAVFLFGY